MPTRNMNQKVKFATLGCRLNQYETQAIREQFQNAGFEETQVDEEANVFVINTCTVTSDSDRTSRYLIRKCHRLNPSAKVVVTGCYVERNESEIKAIPGVTLTVLNRQKPDIAHLLESCTALSFPPVELLSKRRFVPLSISQFEGRTRAYIKIQDGCNHACSFCKVVLVRGPARSRPLAEVVDEAMRLADEGFQEVVLTGIQLGAYGLDFEKRQMLADLLDGLRRISNLKRIRLSSIEPTDVTEELIDAMASIEKVCPHLHIPVQSGDDQILERMNRRYHRHFYIDLVEKLRSRVKNFVLTTDVMVGFPGETHVHFDQTLQLLTGTRPYKLHVFPYSVREGTKAARFQDLVRLEEIRRRKDVLFLLESKLRREVQEEFLGLEMVVLIEDDMPAQVWVAGRGANYLKIRLPIGEMEAGDLVWVRLEAIERGDFIGRPLGKEKYDLSNSSSSCPS